MHQLVQEARSGLLSTTITTRQSIITLIDMASLQFIDEDFTVQCPYCGENVSLYLEADVKGDLIQDCEVCCRPWAIQVVHNQNGRNVHVRCADGSE